MLTPNAVLDFVRAQPFRPFRIHMASGQTLDIRHPEMIKVLRSNFLVFTSTGESPDIPDEFQRASLMLSESISHLEASVA
jgi:hypothetical protein